MTSECHRVAAVLDVYLDDETAPETNAFVQQHVERCAACAARVRELRDHREAVRSAMTQERAPDALRARVRDSLVAPRRPWLSAAIRTWLPPATAAVGVLLVVLRGSGPGTAEVELAVAEHVACAINGRASAGFAPVTASFMPWVPDAGRTVRIVDAHICGRDRQYQHVVFEHAGAKASILITAAAEGPEPRAATRINGDYEISLVRSARHAAFVITERRADAALGAWREPAVHRVRRFLQQLEGS